MLLDDIGQWMALGSRFLTKISTQAASAEAGVSVWQRVDGWLAQTLGLTPGLLGESVPMGAALLGAAGVMAVVAVVLGWRWQRARQQGAQLLDPKAAQADTSGDIAEKALKEKEKVSSPKAALEVSASIEDTTSQPLVSDASQSVRLKGDAAAQGEENARLEQELEEKKAEQARSEQAQLKEAKANEAKLELEKTKAQKAQANEAKLELEKAKAQKAQAEQAKLEKAKAKKAELEEKAQAEQARLELEKAEAERAAAQKAELKRKLELEEAKRKAAAAEEQAKQAAKQQAKQSSEHKAKQEADLRRGLARSSAGLIGRIKALFAGKADVDEDLLDDLEEILLTADVGVGLATDFVDALRDELEAERLVGTEAVHAALAERLLQALDVGDSNEGGACDVLPIHKNSDTGPDAGPKVLLFVGVNGAGKTTSIGKIAQKLRDQGAEVVLAAGDTFRAAAKEQLSVWADRTGARLIAGDAGADPASVVFNAIHHAQTTGADYVLADTAGRLHTQGALMEEIQKVKRAAVKAQPGAPHEVWLVVDGTTGQNGLVQAREFHRSLGLTGLILTKLDGTARGGVVVAIADGLKIPVRFVGVGEKASDLQAFDPKRFVDALLAA